MFKTLYKRSHFVAAGIFAALMITASAAAATVAMINDRATVQREAQHTTPSVGRFVVTPTSAQFIPATNITSAAAH